MDAEERPELTREYGVKQAPTLIVREGQAAEKFANASNIKRFIEERKTAGQAGALL